LGKPVSRLVTPNGDALLIQTVKPLDPVIDRDTDRDVYHWDVQEGWSCLSCQEPGLPSGGESSIDVFTANHIPEFTMNRMNFELHTPMSDDGRRVFFTSYDALVSQDINSVADVYEWHDGTVDLISTGTGTQPSALIGASRSGSNAFFITARPLVGWDIDSATDIYDARAGGGFAAPPPIPPPCGEGECSTGRSEPPPMTPAGSLDNVGPGDPPPTRPSKPCKKGQVRKRGHCVRKPVRHGGRHPRHSTRKGR
jgi:hypothetical protein